MKKITLVGAGGKVGRRLVEKLKNDPAYEMAYVEKQSEALKPHGVEAASMETALAGVDYVILSVPDRLLHAVSAQAAPLMKRGAVMVTLDPAATYAGAIAQRADLTYLVIHPNHPSVFTASSDPAVQEDFWGGVAPQDVVCALSGGCEGDKPGLEALARKMFAPVERVFWITAEQMCILEPGIVELITAPLFEAMRLAMERVIEMGVPREVAHSFVTGHLRPQLHMAFGKADPEGMSDGAKEARRRGMELLLKPGWIEAVLNLDFIGAFTREIADFHDKA